MSVAIAAPQAKLPASPSNSDKAAPTDAPEAGGDFASLLRGQLAVGTESPQAPAKDALTQADASIATIAELVPQDTASLLAALGIIQPAQQTPPQAGKSGVSRISDGAMSALPESLDIAQPGKTENILLPLASPPSPSLAAKTEQGNELGIDREARPGAKPGDFIPPAAYGADEPTAKIAVGDPALPKTEPLLAGSLSNESATTGTTGLSAHAPAAIQRNAEVLKLDTPVRDQNWATDFNQKVVWLASNDKQVAQITLNPPQMGPIEISLNLNKDGASAMFVSQNAEVREAIETALPRLREMLAGAGIELGQANVSAESFRQQAGGQDARQGTPRWASDNAILDDGSEFRLSGQAIVTQQRGNGLVNTFA